MRATIDARYRVVTPLFCAGAEPDRPESRPELRLPSFKGVLRFWWRALAWSRFRGDIGAILREEDELFGSAKGGQSRVSMRLAPDPHPDSSKISIGKVLTVSRMNQRVVGEGARYLGYGVMEAFASSKKNTKAGQLTRACLRSPFDFTVQMRARDLSEDGLSSLTDALVALGTIGGMGAKNRKGYGSLVIRSLHVNGEEPWHAPQAMNDLRDAIAGLRYGDTSATLPEFTALSTRTRHVLISSNQIEPIALLDLVGRELVRYRSWGHGGKILGSRIDSEKNFEDDHNLMKGRLRKTHPVGSHSAFHTITGSMMINRLALTTNILIDARAHCSSIFTNATAYLLQFCRFFRPGSCPRASQPSPLEATGFLKLPRRTCIVPFTVFSIDFSIRKSV